MKPIVRLIPLLLISIALLAACGGGGSDNTISGNSGGSDDTSSGDTGGGSSQPSASVASLVARTDTTQITSDGSQTATITALAKDASNNVVAEVPVSFQADSGTLEITQAATDATGVATATLTTANNAANRTVTVTVSSGSKTDSVQVQVTGTSLSIDGPSALASNDSGQYVVTLKDSSGAAISGKPVTLKSARGNTISAANTVTNASGQIGFALMPISDGKDTITAQALGAVGSKVVDVSSDSFDLSISGTDCDSVQNGKRVIALNTSCAVTATWEKAGVPQAGQVIHFATTRGNLTPVSATTDASGVATVHLSSANAGPADIIASTTTGGPSSRISARFIATNPATIALQADNSTIGPQDPATLTATVRDANNNLVSNANVTFSIMTDTTGGTLSTPSATTDFNGQAQTVYTAGRSTSAKDGVKIRAVVYDKNGNEVGDDIVPLTVSGNAISITLGTGNKIEMPNDQQYKQPYVVQVADASGNPVVGATVDLSIEALGYQKGCWNAYTGDAPSTHLCGTDATTTTGNLAMATSAYALYLTTACVNEDLNRNGILDPGEDDPDPAAPTGNGNGRLDPGTPAVVTPKTVTTDSTGSAQFGIYYPKDHAYWVIVQLTATTRVSGTERATSVNFVLTGAADDYNDTDTAVPGPTSPYGITNSCFNPG